MFRHIPWHAATSALPSQVAAASARRFASSAIPSSSSSTNINKGQLASMLFPKSVLRKGLVKPSEKTSLSKAERQAMKLISSVSTVPFNVKDSSQLMKVARFRANSAKARSEKKRPAPEIHAHLRQSLRDTKMPKALKNVPGCSPADRFMVEAEAEWLAKLQVGAIKKKTETANVKKNKTAKSQKKPLLTTSSSAYSLDASTMNYGSRSISREQYASILLYSQGSLYRDLNTALRSLEVHTATTKTATDVAPYLGYLKLLLTGLSQLPQQKRRLYRGVNHDDPSIVVGSTLTWWGVSSCSVCHNAALGFTMPDPNSNKDSPLVGFTSSRRKTLFTIDAIRAIDISSLSFFPGEAECLLVPGTELQVVSITPASQSNDWISRVHLKEVTNSAAATTTGALHE